VPDVQRADVPDTGDLIEPERRKESEMTTTPTRLRRLANRVQRTWSEMDHAQRRLLEIRTGQPFVTPTRRASVAVSVAELEALYAAESSHRDRG
jgi:hypothetical protein